MKLHNLIKQLPKAELHLHIEGSLEPELLFEIGKRNNVESRFSNVEELRQAYKFDNLQEFLDIYYEGANVLLHEVDFYEMTLAYLKKVHSENVVHVEIFFDPQTHTERGVPFETVVNGIHNALQQGEREFGITFKLIMCFVRHLDESSAFETLESALAYKSLIYGVGLDSSELGNPPSKFQRVFEKAIAEGFVPVAHAGEEGPAEYVWEALNLLKVARIDHGNRALVDAKLTAELAKRKIALTVCPLSNLKLCVVKDLKDHPIKTMLQKGLVVTINSDDPAYFGGYLTQNFIELADAVNLSEPEIIQLVKNGFTGSFMDDDSKEKWLIKIDQLVEQPR